jgi:hypothetical protein
MKIREKLSIICKSFLIFSFGDNRRSFRTFFGPTLKASPPQFAFTFPLFLIDLFLNFNGNFKIIDDIVLASGASA